MKKYLRLQDNKIMEFITLNDDQDISKMYGADLIFVEYLNENLPSAFWQTIWEYDHESKLIVVNLQKAKIYKKNLLENKKRNKIWELNQIINEELPLMYQIPDLPAETEEERKFIEQLVKYRNLKKHENFNQELAEIETLEELENFVPEILK